MLASLVVIAVISISLNVTTTAQDEPILELDSYMLVMDEVITRDKDVADCLWFGSDVDAVRSKVKELGVEFPPHMKFAGETLFLIVVTDRLGQAFDDVSGIERQGIVIIDMKERRDEDEPAPQPAEAKSARVMVIACSPVLWAKTFELRTSDRKRHALKAVRLESPRSPASKPASIE